MQPATRTRWQRAGTGAYPTESHHPRQGCVLRSSTLQSLLYSHTIRAGVTGTLGDQLTDVLRMTSASAIALLNTVLLDSFVSATHEDVRWTGRGVYVSCSVRVWDPGSPNLSPVLTDSDRSGRPVRHTISCLAASQSAVHIVSRNMSCRVRHGLASETENGNELGAPTANLGSVQTSRSSGDALCHNDLDLVCRKKKLASQVGWHA